MLRQEKSYLFIDLVAAWGSNSKSTAVLITVDGVSHNFSRLKVRMPQGTHDDSEDLLLKSAMFQRNLVRVFSTHQKKLAILASKTSVISHQRDLINLLVVEPLLCLLNCSDNAYFFKSLYSYALLIQKVNQLKILVSTRCLNSSIGRAVA